MGEIFKSECFFCDAPIDGLAFFFYPRGLDREFVADQFLTCNLRAMRTGDVQYACILDSKGLIMDDAFVFLEDGRVAYGKNTVCSILWRGMVVMNRRALGCICI